MASEVSASSKDFTRRRSSGGLRRNASHDISDQISENKLVDLKKVASAESTFTEEQGNLAAAASAVPADDSKEEPEPETEVETDVNSTEQKSDKS